MGEGVRLYEPLKPFDWRDQRTLTAEEQELLAIFTELLRGPTADGASKRASGNKAFWKEDPTHEDAAWRHLNRKLDGDVYDEDSGYHAYIHAAWRLLAVAFQEGARLSDRKEATSLRASDGE